MRAHPVRRRRRLESAAARPIAPTELAAVFARLDGRGKPPGIPAQAPCRNSLALTLPVLDAQTCHPLKFAGIVGDQGQRPGSGLSSYQYVIGTNGRANSS